LQLTEGVRLEFETAVLVAESALFVFDADRMLLSFDMLGMPAELSDFVDGSSKPFRVSAERIVYDRESGTLKMPGEVEFLDGDTEGSAGSPCDLTYRLEDKTYGIGSPQCGFSLSLSPVGTEDAIEETPDEP
jgi:lipopolysaccharide export system protein LptA